MKNMLWSGGGSAGEQAEPQSDIVVAQLAQELYSSNLLLALIRNLPRIEFEVS